MFISNYLGLLRGSEEALSVAFMDVAQHHFVETEIQNNCQLLARWSDAHVTALQPFVDRYQAEDVDEPGRLRRALFHGPRVGPLGLLRDLQDLYVLATEVHTTWHVLNQAAQALRDKELQAACVELGREAKRQLAWLHTELSALSPQVLVAADPPE